MDHAHPARLGELVRGLAAEHPNIEVFSDVRAVETVPEGSVVVLLPRAEDASWLNVRRPVFARRSLRVVLFCDHETTVALAEQAVDFFDWISQHHVCPEGPPWHTILGFRAAIAANALGIAWTGDVGEKGDVERLSETFAAACPELDLQWVHPERDYAQLLADLRAAQSKWVVARISSRTHAWRFRWALAETKMRARAIIFSAMPVQDAFWEVHDRLMSFDEAHRRLAEAGATRPGTLATMTGLEPEAVQLAKQILQYGTKQEELISMLVGASDPGAALAKRAHEGGWLDEDSIATYSAAPPILRALADTPRVRALRGNLIEDARHDLITHAKVPPKIAGLWAAKDDEHIIVGNWPSEYEQQWFVIEKLVRQELGAEGWANIAEHALLTGHENVATLWALRSIQMTGSISISIQRIMGSFSSSDRGNLLNAIREKEKLELKGFKIRLGIVTIIIFSLFVPMFVPSIHEQLYLRPATRNALLAASIFLMTFVIIARLGLARANIRASIPKVALEGDGYSTERDAALRAYAAGQYHEAEKALLHVRYTIVRKLGAEHPDYRHTLRTLISLLVDFEDKRALEFLFEALSLEGRLSTLHESTFVALMVDTSILLLREGALRESGLILERILGPDASLEMPKDESKLDISFLRKEPKANEYIQQFLGISEPLEVTPELGVRALRASMQWLLTQGRYAEANAMADKMHSFPPEKLRSVNLDRLRIVALQGRALALLGHYEEGVQLLRNAVKAATDEYGPHQLDTARLLLQLARIEARQEKDLVVQTAKRALEAFANTECTDAERAAALQELGAIVERGTAD